MYIIVRTLLISFVSSLLIISAVMANVTNDSVITAKIKSEMVANPLTHPLEVNVVTKNGVVYLSGAVETNTEAATIVQIAESTKYVSDVNTDNLSVSNSNDSTAGQTLKDSYITAKIKGLYIRNHLVSDRPNVPMSITVETKNGIVYLGGTADKKSQVREAVKVANSVDGVNQVISGIQLNS